MKYNAFKYQSPAASPTSGHGHKFKAILTAAFSGLFVLPALANTGVSTTPIATVNTFSAPASCAMPYASMWHGSFTSTANGGLVSFNSSLGSTSLMINNVGKTDFSQAGAVALDVSNPTGSEADFILILHDNGSGVIQTIFSVPANSSRKFALMLCPTGTASNYGVLCLPAPYQGFTCAPGFKGESANLKSIANVMLGPAGNSPASKLVISNLRLLPSFNWNSLMTGAIDSYGQSAITSWSGKLTDSSQFATRRAAEEATFTSAPDAQKDSFGGSLSLPAQKPTGHFRTQQINGKWWLVDPLGHLFFMNGVDEVRTVATSTMVTGRQQMFSSLPASNDPLAANYTSVTGGTAFNFYTSNLQRKYGANWEQSWLNTMVNRFHSWGINSLGSFAADEAIATHQFPYVYKTDLSGKFNTVSTGSDLWGPMPDPFDPAFATAAAQTANYVAPQANGDPNMIGIIVGNELSWTGNTGTSMDQYALSLGTLAQNAASSPAKTAFLATLNQEYGTIGALNSAWGTSFSSWSSLNAPLSLGTKLSLPLQKDLMHWVGSYAYQYYQTIKRALKKVAPNTLYLGNSYSLANMTPQVLWEAQFHVDMLCFNMYGTTMNPQIAADTVGMNLPMMITEFNFTSTSDGLWGGFVPTPDQSSRAAAYANYVHMIATNPNFVGLNFYMYADQAASGALTNQNNCQGLVDVTDTPYPEMVNALKSTAQTIYQTRWNF